jgi:hypothetical protein
MLCRLSLCFGRPHRGCSAQSSDPSLTFPCPLEDFRPSNTHIVRACLIQGILAKLALEKDNLKEGSRFDMYFRPSDCSTFFKFLASLNLAHWHLWQRVDQCSSLSYQSQAPS